MLFMIFEVLIISGMIQSQKQNKGRKKLKLCPNNS